MPESTCLHIQDRHSGPIRVVEIPWMTVRIGRAAYCEVRLTEAGLADEVCRLQRRGRSWNLVPLSLKGGPILVQDRSIEGPHPLPFDVPFRIGGSCLTLRQNRGAEPDWGMYEAPRPATREQPWAAAEPVAERPHMAELHVDDPPTPPYGCGPDPPPQRGEGLMIFPSPLVGEGQGGGGRRAEVAAAPGQPPDPPARPKTAPVNPWEARWKAAGARLPGAPGRPPKVARTQPFHASDRYPDVPLKEPSVARPRPAEPPVPPPSRGFSTEPPAAGRPDTRHLPPSRRPRGSTAISRPGPLPGPTPQAGPVRQARGLRGGAGASVPGPRPGAGHRLAEPDPPRDASRAGHQPPRAAGAGSRGRARTGAGAPAALRRHRRRSPRGARAGRRVGDAWRPGSSRSSCQTPSRRGPDPKKLKTRTYPHS